MPWLSSSPSPPGSPRAASPPAPGSPSVTYIPPLIDGACGTMPRAHQSLAQVMRDDARAMARMLPGLLKGMAAELRRVIRSGTWVDMFDTYVHAMLSVFETVMIAMALPLWICLPGALFGLWVAAHVMFVGAVGWFLNGREHVIRCSSGSNGWMMGQEAADERWMFVGGATKSSRFMAKSTLPYLSKLFSRPMTAIHIPTYGMPFDMAMAFLQRCVPFSTPTTRHLYTQLRASLLDSRISRTVMLADNIGSIPLSQVLRDLCADLPPEKIAKLEIYTFGAAAAEFLTPLGEGPKDKAHHTEFTIERKAPHIEHFAHERDSFAQFGVLHGVRENLEGRFCGGVFVLQEGPETKATSTWAPSIVDYLSCLFPAQASCELGKRLLDHIMLIDRDVAEKREFAAMASYASSVSVKKGSKRLSWTGLGATVNGENGMMDGVIGLEMARRGCKDCDGHRGREVSWLVRYANIGQYSGGRDGLDSKVASPK